MLLVVIIMFYNVLWGFSIDPPYLVMTLQDKKTLFCIFLSFRDLPRLKLTQDFWRVNILSREAPRGEEVNEARPRGQTSTGGAAPSQAAPPIPVWASSLQHRQSSSPDAQLDLITSIYRSPLTIAIGGGREILNAETEAVPAKIGGGNAAGVAPKCFSTLSDVNTTITAMKRE
jgi:hypothetical protein